MNRQASAWIAGLAVFACALVGGANGPQRPRSAAWYFRLRKPTYTPPGPVIGATWGVLEALLIASGYKLLRAPSSVARTTAISGWSLTLLGLAGFPWLFFRQRRLGASTLAAAAMMASAATSAIASSRVDKRVAGLSAPLLGWLSFATLLSEELYRRNRSRSAD